MSNDPPRNPPTCKKCKGKVVRGEAGFFSSITYWYCRECKIEVGDLGYEIKPQEGEDPLAGSHSPGFSFGGFGIAKVEDYSLINCDQDGLVEFDEHGEEPDSECRRLQGY